LEQALRWQDGVDLGELNAAAAILQKLIASWQQVDGQRLAQMPRQEKNGGCGIGEEDLRHLEERLRLL
jgi:hypothetical protein